MKNSIFLNERYFESAVDQFPIDAVRHPGKATRDQLKKLAVWITGALDEVGTKFIWNAHYEKALAQKMAEPVKYADDVTRKLVAGRGIGEVPIVQKARVFQVVAPFQLEVGNLWWVLKDMAVKEKDIAGLIRFMLS